MPRLAAHPRERGACSGLRRKETSAAPSSSSLPPSSRLVPPARPGCWGRPWAWEAVAKWDGGRSKEDGGATFSLHELGGGLGLHGDVLDHRDDRGLTLHHELRRRLPPHSPRLPLASALPPLSRSPVSRASPSPAALPLRSALTSLAPRAPQARLEMTHGGGCAGGALTGWLGFWAA